jgi:DNA-binding NtrC family response regulator
MRTILVIDDEKPTLALFGMLLTAMGYRVLTASSGLEGLALFELERPGAVFTDLKMPDMDGLEVLRRIKALDSSAEVIVVTGHGDVELALGSLNLDAADFIDKPIRTEALTRALARAEERLSLREDAAGQVCVREERGVTVVEIRGRLRAASERQLGAAGEVAAARGLPVAVSLTPAATITGSGIALLAEFFALCRSRGLAVAAAAPSETQRALLAGPGLDAAVHATENDALDALRSVP